MASNQENLKKAILAGNAHEQCGNCKISLKTPEEITQCSYLLYAIGNAIFWLHCYEHYYAKPKKYRFNDYTYVKEPEPESCFPQGRIIKG